MARLTWKFDFEIECGHTVVSWLSKIKGNTVCLETFSFFLRVFRLPFFQVGVIPSCNAPSSMLTNKVERSQRLNLNEIFIVPNWNTRTIHNSRGANDTRASDNVAKLSLKKYLPLFGSHLLVSWVYSIILPCLAWHITYSWRKVIEK